MDIGCRPIDKMTRGLLEGSITQFYGEFATGKTTYCLQAAVAVSKNGKRTIYIDTENGFSPERLIQIGGRDVLKDVDVFYPDDLGEQTQIIKGLEQTLSSDVGLIVVDSFVALYKVDATDVEKRSELLCDLSLQLLILSRIARKRNIPIVITNHVYEDFKKEQQMPLGGNTLKYWSKVIILLSKAHSSRRKADLIRHPFIGDGAKCYFTLVQNGLGSDE